MTDDPVLDIRQDGRSTPAASLDAVVMLVHSFGSMVSAMEARLATQIKDNAEASKDRWQTWEREFARYQEATENRLHNLEQSVHDHHAEAERERLATEARVKPITTVIGWIWVNRRDLVIIAVGIATFLGVALLQIEHVQ